MERRWNMSTSIKKATAISREDKLKVYTRLGRGIEQNIVTLRRECHREFHEGKKHNEYKEKIQTYLDLLYPDFSDYDRIYHKW